MLYSTAGRLQEAADAFVQALAMDDELAGARGFAGYNAALLGRPWETLPAVERAMRLDSSDRRHSVWYFFWRICRVAARSRRGSACLLEKSLERNPSYASAQLFLMAALSLLGRPEEASRLAESFRSQNSEHPANAFKQLWLSRSPSPVYRAQVYPLFERIIAL